MKQYIYYITIELGHIRIYKIGLGGKIKSTKLNYRKLSLK